MIRRAMVGAVVAALAIVMLGGCEPEEGRTATVDRVIDGDTLVTDAGERVRLLGIDAPETGECGADAATTALTQLVEGRTIVLIGEDQDRYGRTLAYIEAGRQDIGERLVHDGWAAAWHPASSKPPVRHPAYLRAQADAQKAQRGSWAACQTVGR